MRDFCVTVVCALRVFLGVLCVCLGCVECGLVVVGVGFGGVWCEVDGDEVFVLLCVFWVVFVLEPAYSVCDVDCSVGD